jgi:hypothetical protein
MYVLFVVVDLQEAGNQRCSIYALTVCCQFVEYVTGISIDQLKDCLLPQNQPKNRYANVVARKSSRW